MTKNQTAAGGKYYRKCVKRISRRVLSWFGAGDFVARRCTKNEEKNERIYYCGRCRRKHRENVHLRKLKTFTRKREKNPTKESFHIWQSELQHHTAATSRFRVLMRVTKERVRV